ncbi:VOC family protein [Spongiimicrobium salis]|uniref:VOC family protein n=1 Tax=Spongiimicrobium salis TaxID=1667022 RepID=UPI00374CFFD9
MKVNHFVFADLSTYSPKNSIAFYERLFGWTYYENNKYYTAFLGNTQVSGLYETPETFKQMRMPHFWMSYIQVENLEHTITRAKQLGGIVELNYNMEGFGKVALIRDVQGAGFTVYEGSQLKNTRTENLKNTLIWNELQVSDVEKVIPFYKGLFNWTMKPIQNGFYQVLDHKGEHITDIMEISNQYKGKYEYWVCTFGVECMTTSKKLVLGNGGSLIYQEKDRMLFSDHSNEAFFYLKEV